MLGIEDHGSDVENGDEGLNSTSQSTQKTSTSLSQPPPTSRRPPKSSSPFSLPGPSSSSSTSTQPRRNPNELRKWLPISHRRMTVHPRRTPGLHRAQARASSPCSVYSQHQKSWARDREEGITCARRWSWTRAGLSYFQERAPASGRRPRCERRGRQSSKDAQSAPSTSFLPPSLTKGRANVSAETPGSSEIPPPSYLRTPKNPYQPRRRQIFSRSARTRPPPGRRPRLHPPP